MDPAEQREIARKGGRASHGRQEAEDRDEDEDYSRGTRGGSSEQHAEAGRQSHKNR